MIKFILGILFAEVGIPLLDSAVELIQMAMEKKKGKYAVEVAKKNQEVRKISGDEEEPGPVHAIGFCAPDRNDEEELDDDDDL